MLYIAFKNPKLEAPHSLPQHDRDRMVNNPVCLARWWVGDQLPWPLNAQNKHLVVMVQADGHELTSIESTCKNLPVAYNKPVQTWRGDMAQFIVDNVIDG